MLEEEGSPVNLFHARNATRIIATIYLIDHIKFKTVLNFCFKLSIESLFFVEKSFVESIARKAKGFSLLIIILNSLFKGPSFDEKNSKTL